MIKKYNQFLNESILDKLEGPTDEEVFNNLKELSPNEILVKSSEVGFLKGVKKALELGADIHVGYDEPLISAAYYGHLDVVKYLVEHGADIHANDEFALKSAARKGHLDVVKYLVEHGADIHADNDNAIFFSSFYGHLDIVEYLEEQIKKEKLTESLLDELKGPTREEIMKNFGIEIDYDTPEEFLENFLDGDITMGDFHNNVYWYKYGKIIFRLDKDTGYFYMCDKLIKIFKYIYNVSELDLKQLLYDFVGEELNWKTFKEKFYPCYRHIRFNNEYK